jgi:poly-gamma-glutamate capsule biosynthesis protein CapA/YwtB (metallophosphatase superfamily)
MLGRGVGAALSEYPRHRICAPEIVEVAGSADAFIANLECCISERGTRRPDPRKPFFFRAPPAAAHVLADLGVDAVTLGNNHAMDFGPEALRDTIAVLDAVGIAHAGAGSDSRTAREPAVLTRAETTIVLLSLSDHPADFAAMDTRPGIAFADLQTQVPAWITDAIAHRRDDLVVVSPHWGPNMATTPLPHVRHSARTIASAGADLIAGHSAHIFQGIEVLSGCTVLYDLGDFIDDYAVDELLRNDLGCLWLVTFEGSRAIGLEVLPLKLEFTHTRVAEGADRAWITRRLRHATRPFETHDTGDLLRIDLS